jgi:hypothetical protein
MKRTLWTTPALLLLALVISACGQKNESGKGNNTWQGHYGLGNYTGPVPMNITNPYVNRVFQALPCTPGGFNMGNQRMSAGQYLNGTVAFNATYVGITLEGDVAVITNDQTGRAVLSLYICPRPGVTSAYSSQPKTAQSIRGCKVDEITALDVDFLPNRTYPTLTFFPAHLNPTLYQALECTR